MAGHYKQKQTAGGCCQRAAAPFLRLGEEGV